MIDIENDSLVTVRALALKRLGREVSYWTVWNWIRRGVHGAKLEAVQVGGVWHTTKQAFAEFIKKQTARKLADVPGPGPIRIQRTPEQAAAKAARMKKLGLGKR